MAVRFVYYFSQETGEYLQEVVMRPPMVSSPLPP